MPTTRRSFIKKTAATAIATAAMPYIFTSPARAEELYDDDLTIGAIGVGGSRGRYKRGRDDRSPIRKAWER